MDLWSMLIFLDDIGEIARKTNSIKDWMIVFIIYLIFYIGIIIGIIISLIILYYVTIFYLKFFSFLLSKLQLLNEKIKNKDKRLIKQKKARIN